MEEAPQRYAVVTGANKGIGLEIVRQLASVGIKVVLTARDEKRGLQALQTLKDSGLSDLVVFHQLDVANPASVASLADFVKSEFGKLDILVNNAGINGIEIKDNDLYKLAIINLGEVNNAGIGGVEIKDVDLFNKVIVNPEAISDDELRKAMTQTYESAEECLQINYYGAKRAAESLLPLLQLSNSPIIVNVAGGFGKIEYVSNEWAKGVFSDADNLTEERVDEVLKEFLKDFKEGSLKSKGWPRYLAAYILSKASMIAHTRILAKKYPSICINSVCPGYVKTDMTVSTGFFTAEEGAAHPVRLALLPNGSPSGLFYIRSEASSFS